MKIVFFQWLIFTLYTSFVWIKYGVQRSISESWYTIEPKEKFLFSIFCFGLGLPMWLYDSIWFIVAGSLLCFVGSATMFKEKTTGIIHNIGAAGAIVVSLAGLVTFDIWIPALLMAAGFVALQKVENKVWWVETLAVYLILSGLWYFS